MSVFVCVQCNLEVITKSSHQRKFCSRRCRREYDSARRRAVYPYAAVAKAKIGAATELLVSADLLRRGFDVFRAVSPSAPCDVVAMKGGRLYRIEIKTAPMWRDGGLEPRPTPTWERERGVRYDVLACVLGDKVSYFPDVEAHEGLCGAHGEAELHEAEAHS